MCELVLPDNIYWIPIQDVIHIKKTNFFITQKLLYHEPIIINCIAWWVEAIIISLVMCKLLYIKFKQV